MAEEKKSTFQKIKEKFDDKEEQLEVLGTFIRLGVMVLSNMSNRRERTIIDIYNRLNQLSQAVSRLEGQNR